MGSMIYALQFVHDTAVVQVLLVVVYTEFVEHWS